MEDTGIVHTHPPACADIVGSYMVLIFRTARTSMQKMVKFACSPLKKSKDVPIHVDIGMFIPTCENGEENFTVYSAYMDENLQATNIHENNYDTTGKLDMFYAIELTTQEAEAVKNFLTNLVAKPTPYNYSDLALCAMPHFICRQFPDVSINNIQSVFCSQLAILALRDAMLESAPCKFRQLIWGVNSRCISPAQLLPLLRPYMFRIKAGDYLKGQIQSLRH
eukprot:2267694-Rhodomonas_salina.1